MTDDRCDFFVIGAGSGGIRAARTAATLGARVMIAEADALGGTCVNRGCIPKKLFVHAAQFAESWALASGFGWKLLDTPRFCWEQLLFNKDREIKRLNSIYQEILERSDVTIIRERASIQAPGVVRVGNRTVRARHILIATGGRPRPADFPGGAHTVNSDALFHMKRLPKSLIIIGGGYIAAEFASIFNGLGVHTTLLYRGKLLLRGFDTGLRQALVEALRAQGIMLHLNAQVQDISRHCDEFLVRLEGGKELLAEAVLCAIGRSPNTNGLGLQEQGVQLNEQGAIVVNRYYQTSQASVYAIGDVTDRLNLTPVAIAEGTALAHTLFGTPQTVNYSGIPRCVFTNPPLASVGLDEEEARSHYPNIQCFGSKFRPLRYTLANENQKTASVIKVLVDGDTDQVLGAHMLGADAPEIIQGMAIAMKAGARKQDLDATCGIHPSSAEEFTSLSAT